MLTAGCIGLCVMWEVDSKTGMAFAVSSILSADETLPTIPKPAAADEDPSATAGSLRFSYLSSISPAGVQLQSSAQYRSDRA